MDFTNINDPAGVKALLEQLRSSQAWQEALTPPEPTPGASSSSAGSSNAPVSAPTVDPRTAAAAPPAATPSSVAALLSQLQASSSYAAIAPAPPHEDARPALPHAHFAQPAELPPSPAPDVPPVGNAPAITPSSARPLDLRGCTFQQALSHLAALSEDAAFVDAISMMKKEQADLERKLWVERQAIQHSHEEKVKVACTKAKLIGAGLTQYEADMMSDAFRREFRKFDSERALKAWDGLMTKQQAMLESLGVPAMYPTTVKAERERQQRIITVLAGIVPSETT